LLQRRRRQHHHRAIIVLFWCFVGLKKWWRIAIHNHYVVVLHAQKNDNEHVYRCVILKIICMSYESPS
jgi:hypothetical protein